MHSDRDPIAELLLTADAASNVAGSSGNLLDRIHRRSVARATSERRIKMGLFTGVVVLLGAVSLTNLSRRGDRQDIQIANKTDESGDIAQLQSQADALGAEAAALKRQLTIAAHEQTRQLLRQEHLAQVMAWTNNVSVPSALDRAALVGLSQGDFYRDIRQSLDDAKTAYENVIAEYPDSRWAALAQSRIEQLPMN